MDSRIGYVMLYIVSTTFYSGERIRQERVKFWKCREAQFFFRLNIYMHNKFFGQSMCNDLLNCGLNYDLCFITPQPANLWTLGQIKNMGRKGWSGGVIIVNVQKIEGWLQQVDISTIPQIWHF